MSRASTLVQDINVLLNKNEEDNTTVLDGLTGDDRDNSRDSGTSGNNDEEDEDKAGENKADEDSSYKVRSKA